VPIIRRSPEFAAWLDRLADQKARARIFNRLDRASLGNFGDCKPVGEGVSEMRIDVGPGYRLYFVREGGEVYVLLVGGDKSSQKRDIQTALAMARKLKQDQGP
jgi:putative addiction module killer protein